MSHLRQQLHRAQSVYAAARYPGDLAADVLPVYGTLRRRLIIAASSLASLAAAVAVALFLNHLLTSPTVEQQPIDGQIAQANATSLVLPGMPEFPAGQSLVPEYQSLVPEYQAFTLPGMPSFPSMEAADEQQGNAATQESV
jgi:hypothetical protein